MSIGDNKPGIFSVFGYIPYGSESSSRGLFALNEHPQYTLPSYNASKSNLNATGFAIRTGDNGGLANGDGFIIYDSGSSEDYDFIGGQYNLLIGRQVARNKGFQQPSNFNFAIGDFSVSGTDTSEYYTALSHLSGADASDFSYTVMNGYECCRNAQDFANSVFIGSASMKDGNICNTSVGIGRESLVQVFNANNVVAIGYRSSFESREIFGSIFIGPWSGSQMPGSSTNDENIGIGYNTLRAGEGSQNICLGSYSGQGLVGSQNILIGESTGKNDNNIDNCIFIGNGLTADYGSEYLQIGHSSTTYLAANLTSANPAFFPATDGTTRLGGSSNRWSVLNTVDADLSGDLIFSSGQSNTTASSGSKIYYNASEDRPKWANTSDTYNLQTTQIFDLGTCVFRGVQGNTSPAAFNVVKDTQTGLCTCYARVVSSTLTWNQSHIIGEILTLSNSSNNNPIVLPSEVEPTQIQKDLKMDSGGEQYVLSARNNGNITIELLSSIEASSAFYVIFSWYTPN